MDERSNGSVTIDAGYMRKPPSKVVLLYILLLRQRSSAVELWFCKPVVIGSNPIVGLISRSVQPAGGWSLWKRVKLNSLQLNN